MYFLRRYSVFAVEAERLAKICIFKMSSLLLIFFYKFLNYSYKNDYFIFILIMELSAIRHNRLLDQKYKIQIRNI